MFGTLASVILGLACALVWGAGDFSGGLATRRTNVYGVAVVSHGSALLLLLAISLPGMESLPSPADLGWGLAAGAAGAFGVLALYKALAMGRMGIAAPITAVISASLPVAVGLLEQGLPHWLQLVGFALALAGVWFLARPEGAGGRPEGLGLAILAGLG